MDIKEEIIKALILAQIPSPRLEANIIIKHAAPDYPDITDSQKQTINSMLQRRCNHEPLDKIIGQKEFYKSVFKVNQNVLSPRPDTEILVERALDLMSKDKPYKVLDLGTGSGCILLSLLKECPLALGVGVDISKEALEVAKENAALLGVLKRVEFINKSWNDLDFSLKPFDIIVSNPPYIESEEIKKLDKEVKDYDPMLALDGGKDGLDCYRDIALLAKKWLKIDGYILLEVGCSQAEPVKNIFKKEGLEFVEFAKDLAEINRCVILKKQLQIKKISIL